MESHNEAIELAKVMVSRLIKKSGKTPVDGFWNDVEWRRKFQEQIIAAHALLKIYSFTAMMNVLRTKEGSWQYSLRVKTLHELFAVEQRRLEKLEAKVEKAKEIVVSESVEIKPKFGESKNPLKGL
jgi:hypothetical protein